MTNQNVGAQRTEMSLESSGFRFSLREGPNITGPCFSLAISQHLFPLERLVLTGRMSLYRGHQHLLSIPQPCKRKALSSYSSKTPRIHSDWSILGPATLLDQSLWPGNENMDELVLKSQAPPEDDL